MLRDIVEKNESAAVGRVGACKFCGQISNVEALESFTEDEINELATERCDCMESVLYTSKKVRKERAHKEIETLFANEETLVNDEISFLHSTVEPVIGGWLKKVTVQINDNIKMTINETQKGNLKIAKTKNTSAAREI